MTNKYSVQDVANLYVKMYTEIMNDLFTMNNVGVIYNHDTVMEHVLHFYKFILNVDTIPLDGSAELDGEISYKWIKNKKDYYMHVKYENTEKSISRIFTRKFE
jgi:hypothetical protein